jgi:hypothetical protein
MPFSGTLRSVALVRTDVLEECVATITRVTRIGELLTTLAVTSNPKHAAKSPGSAILVTLMMEAIFSSETLILTKVTWRHIPGDGIVLDNRREDLRSYVALTGWARYELGFYIPYDDDLHCHCRENLKSYIALSGWTL